MSQNPMIHTRYTASPLFRAEALSHAEETYSYFSANIEAAERLALLSHACLSYSDLSLSDQDAHMLFKTDFTLYETTDPRDALSSKGILAVNMVGAEMEGADIEFYLREPFVDLLVLDMLYNLVANRKLV